MGSFILKVRPTADAPWEQWNGIHALEEVEPIAGSFDEHGRPSIEGAWCEGTPAKTQKISAWPLREGEFIAFYISGGGGYGSPLSRDTALVQLDVWNELLSPELAREAYGVVINPTDCAVDEPATAALREELRERERRGEWSVPISYYRAWPDSRDELRRKALSPIGFNLAQLEA
jgi:N-methylhydantoinase B